MRRLGLLAGLGMMGLMGATACSKEPAPEPVVVPPQPAQPPPTTAPPPAPPPAPVEPEPVAADPGEPATPPSTDDAAYILARDPRAKGTPRQVALVETEIRGLESLFNAPGGSSSPSTPQIARRIMDDYAESARLHTSAAASQARTRVIFYADKIISGYPTFSTLDEVRYYRALAYDQNGDLKNARSGYYDVIRHHPNSKFIPHSYFAFGEMFFFEASHGDPSKFPLARQAYQEVLKYPQKNNSVFDYAKKKLAQIP